MLSSARTFTTPALMTDIVVLACYHHSAATPPGETFGVPFQPLPDPAKILGVLKVGQSEINHALFPSSRTSFYLSVMHSDVCHHQCY